MLLCDKAVSSGYNLRPENGALAVAYVAYLGRPATGMPCLTRTVQLTENVLCIRLSSVTESDCQLPPGLKEEKTNGLVTV